MILLALLFLACAVLSGYMVLDAVLPVDPDLQEPWSPEQSDTGRLWR